MRAEKMFRCLSILNKKREASGANEQHRSKRAKKEISK